MTVVNLDVCSASSREQEQKPVGGDPAGKHTLAPSVWVKSLLINMNLKSPRSPRSSRNPSLNTKFVASNPEYLNFEAQFQKLEFQGFTYQQNQNGTWATRVLLEDCATDTLLKESLRYVPCSQESLSCSQTLSRGDKSMFNSQMLYDVT